MILSLTYKYIILGTKESYYPVGYYDLNFIEGAKYLTETDMGVSPLFFSLCFSPKVPYFFKRIFRYLTFPKLYAKFFNKKDSICLIVIAGPSLLYAADYISYLGKHYPNIKKVLYLQDIVSSKKYLDIETVKKYFDLILSYDQADCNKYDLIYYPTPYSCYPIQKDLGYPVSDVFFCGMAKNRYSTILYMYDECIKQGLKCVFFVSGIDETMERRDGIIYNTLLGYTEQLHYVQNSKCIVEIMQEGAIGYTPRTWESIIYDKHLLTNNTMLQTTQYYNMKYMHIGYESLRTISQWINAPVSYAEDFKASLSPIKLIMKIDSLL